MSLNEDLANQIVTIFLKQFSINIKTIFENKYEDQLKRRQDLGDQKVQIFQKSL